MAITFAASVPKVTFDSAEIVRVEWEPRQNLLMVDFELFDGTTLVWKDRFAPTPAVVAGNFDPLDDTIRQALYDFAVASGFLPAGTVDPTS